MCFNARCAGLVSMAVICVAHGAAGQLYEGTLAERCAPFKERWNAYKASDEKINADFLPKYNALQQQYGKALENLKVTIQRRGNLEKTKATIAEIERFEETKTIPPTPDKESIEEIQTLQANYMKVLTSLERDKRAQVSTLMKRYERELEQLQGSLVRDGKLEDASVVSEIREQLKRAINEYADRQPKPAAAASIAKPAPATLTRQQPAAKPTTGAPQTVRNGGFTVTRIHPQLGPPGQWVYVDGTFGSDGIEVYFNDVRADRVAVYKAGSLGVTVPDVEDGKATVTVKTPDGQATYSGTYMVGVPTGKPRITGLSPVSGSTGTWVYIQGAQFVYGASTVYVDGEIAARSGVYGPDSIGFSIPDGLSGDVTIMVKTPNGTAESPIKFHIK